MSNLLAIDPGLRNPAAALFMDGVLVAASRVRVPKVYHDMERGTRCMGVAQLIHAWARNNPRLRQEDVIDALITEWPRVYRGTKSKGDPADLFPLAGIGLAVAGMASVPLLNVQAPTAPEWIGNLPKTTTGDPLASPRGHRIWSRLSDAEKAVVVLSHDSLDAIGLGLWGLGRLERRLAL